MSKLLLLFIFLFALPVGAAEPLTDQERQAINYVFTTLSENSSFGLLFHKSELERVGRSFDNVNPYIFLEYIFTDPKMKAAIPKISPMVWRRFVRDYGKRLDRAKRDGELNKEETIAFANKMGFTPEEIEYLVEGDRWNQLFQILIDKFSRR